MSGAVESIHVDFAHKVKVRANEIDTYLMDLRLFGILPYKNVDVQVIQDKMLIPSGIPIGIYVKTNGVLVVGAGVAAGVGVGVGWGVSVAGTGVGSGSGTFDSTGVSAGYAFSAAGGS